MAERMVEVVSMINANISIKRPELGINKKWNNLGQKMKIQFDRLEEALYDPGIRHMFEAGYLYIRSLKDKQDLGLEPEGVDEPVNIIDLDEKKMIDMWKNLPLDVFKIQFGKLTKIQADSLIDYAIDNRIVDVGKCSYIKDITKRDILKAISTKEDMETLDKANSAKV